MGNAKRDRNFVTNLLGVSSVDNETLLDFKLNPATGGLIIDGPSLFAGLDPRYVNITGDTMTGDLGMSADIRFDDTKQLRFGTGDSLRLFNDENAFGSSSLMLAAETNNTTVELLTPSAFNIYANAQLDGLGTWEPSLFLNANGSVNLTNTTQGDAANRIFTINMSAGVLIKGDTYWEGEDSGLLFGTMCVPGVDIEVVIDDNDPEEVKNVAGDGWVTGELNGVTFPTGGDEHYVTITKPGRYSIDWDMSFNMASPGANIEIHGGVMIGGVPVRNNGEAHRTIANNSDTGNMGANCIIDLPNGNEQISLWVLNADNNNNVTITHSTMRVVLIGGT